MGAIQFKPRKARPSSHIDRRISRPAVPSGISCCGDLRWGSHFCHLYETREDLVEVLVPFFATGLANNEQCLWVAAAPLDAAAATAELAKVVPDTPARIASGQLQIVDYGDWYERMGHLDADAVLAGWIEAERKALAAGYTGLRITGNVSFIRSREEWRTFERYEARVSNTFLGRHIVAICSYQLDRTSAGDVLEVMRNHDYALARRDGDWSVIESAATQSTRQELLKLNVLLERRVAERTSELTQALAVVEAQKKELEAALAQRSHDRRQLEAELSDARLLRDIGAALVDEQNVHALYKKLVDAAALVMDSDFASMQCLDADRKALRLIAHRGLSREAEQFWEWVPPGRATSCGAALAAGARVVVDDYEAWPPGEGSADQLAFRAAGVRAAQSTPLLSRTGQLVGMISTHWTRPHRPSERSLALLDILARQAADLIERNVNAEALRSQARQLEEADRRKDEFLATLAHELRNPLAPIKTGLSVLKTAPASQAPRVLGIMERQLSHMVHLIDDLLDVSRISRGIVTLQRAPVALATLLESVLDASQPLVAAAGHSLSVQTPEQAAWLDVDMTRAHQILVNILNNAVKYTPRGGRIALRAEVGSTEVMFQVTDNGLGIPPGHVERIFEMFLQLDTSLERSKGGLGVGLALAKHLVELHGGSITCRSDGPGQGSTFEVRLPLVTEAASKQDCGPADAREAAARLRVLVVDDNEDASEVIGLLLRDWGHAVRVINDAREACAAALAFRPDAIVLDLGMPHINGYDLAMRLREHEELADTTLVALSGWGSEEHRLRSRRAGIEHHLTKPVVLTELQEALAGVVRKG